MKIAFKSHIVAVKTAGGIKIENLHLPFFNPLISGLCRWIKLKWKEIQNGLKRNAIPTFFENTVAALHLITSCIYIFFYGRKYEQIGI